MELEQAIRARRSVRRFTSKEVQKDIVWDLLKVANLAPAPTNRPPWEFLVVHRSFLARLHQVLSEAFSKRIASVGEETMRQALKDLPIPVGEDKDKVRGLGHFYRTLGGAPLAIVIHVAKEDDRWTWNNNISAVGAAIENLLLAALDQGLGTCWLTGPLKTGADSIASALGVPEDREIVALLAVGYPDQQPAMPPKEEVAQKVRWVGFE